MTSKQDTSNQQLEIKEINDRVSHYQNQKHLATQQLSIVRQQLEDIDHFFINYGHYYKFNCMTQMADNHRASKEVRFDAITSDIYHFNKKLTELNDQLSFMYAKDLIQ